MKRSNLPRCLIAMLILGFCSLSTGLSDAAQPSGGSTIAPGLKGQITGITVTPSPQLAAQPVTINVAGSGKCSFNLVLEGFGTRSVPDVDLPTVVPMQFSAGGNLQLTARATGVDCTGEASTTATIVGLTRVSATLGVGKAWTQANITVENNVGKPCSVNIDFGDSSQRGSFYRQATVQTNHAYKSPGSYRVTALGTESFCPGQVDTMINVRDPAANVDPTSAPPVITGTSPYQPIEVIPGLTLTGFAPGSQFVIFLKGQNLGNASYPAQLHLQNRDVDLIVNQRKDDRYLVTIPSDVVGVPDHQASVQVFAYDVIRNIKKESNRYPIPFVATRGFQYWNGSRSLVKYSCSQEADENGCEVRGSTANSTILFGNHLTYCCADGGSDRWELPPLKNGWVYTNVWSQASISDLRNASPRYGHLPDSNLTVIADWQNGAVGSITMYEIRLGIVGPVGGVPYE